MMFVEPLKRVIIDDKALKGEEVREKKFGGFCSCGGIMHQKLWIRNGANEILISECEKCWKNEAMIFNSRRFVRKEDVAVLSRSEFMEFLKEILSDTEFEAVLNKAKGSSYKPSALSRAKKKLAERDIELDEVIEILK